MKHNITLLAALLLGSATAQTVELRILETSDLHTNALGYDYYQDKPTGEFGLEYTASLIRAARNEKPNTLLFDNGDLIQGNPLGDYAARVKPLADGQVHPLLAAMRPLGYTAWTLGNHEFNYGLDYLDRVLKASPFPAVNANVLNMDGTNRFAPYIIHRQLVRDTRGRPYYVNVGVIGFTPPQILQWDKAHLEGKVQVADIVESARKFVPEMTARGADVIVALAHTGINQGTYTPGQEQAGAELSKVDGIDAILTGHSHLEFPSATYKDVPGVNLAKGTIGGKAVTMPGFWGNNLGVIDLKLERQGDRWVVTDRTARILPRLARRAVARQHRVAAAGQRLVAHQDLLAHPLVPALGAQDLELVVEVEDHRRLREAPRRATSARKRCRRCGWRSKPSRCRAPAGR